MRRTLPLALLPLCLLVVLAACVRPGAGRPPGTTEPQRLLLAAVQTWPAPGDSLSLLGVRTEAGEASPETRALDDLLLSALMRAGQTVRPGVGAAAGGQAPDAGGDLWPPGWREQPGPRVAAGTMRVAGPWVYLRLGLADPATGEVLDERRLRLSAAVLETAVAARRRRLTEPEASAAADLRIELHPVVRRDEGGFARRIDWEPGGILDEDDRLQLRFRTDQDCDVFAFLYRSDGDRRVLYDGAAFSGRWLYAPGENAWEVLGTGDEVYTVYFLAAARIEEDRTTLWEEVDRLQSNGRIEKFEGLGLVDDAVTTFLRLTAPVPETGDPAAVRRGFEGLSRTEQERRFIYDDGTTFDSRGYLLEGAAVAVTFSAEIRFR